MSSRDRRRSRRLEMKLPIVVRRRSGEGLAVLHAVTCNISPDGFYFETDSDKLSPGDELELDLTLPPAAGVSAFEGHASAVGEVLRITRVAPDGRIGIAGRFRRPLKLLYS